MSLTIRPATAWTAQSEAWIASALATATLDDMKRQTAHGAQLFEVVAANGAIVAAYVLRVDRLACRTVGVVVAAGGALAGIDLTAAIMPHIEKQFFGCDAISLHTARPGLARKLARQGYRTAEIILEKKVG